MRILGLLLRRRSGGESRRWSRGERRDGRATEVVSQCSIGVRKVGVERTGNRSYTLIVISVFCSACDPRWDMEDEVRDRLGLADVEGMRSALPSTQAGLLGYADDVSLPWMFRTIAVQRSCEKNVGMKRSRKWVPSCCYSPGIRGDQQEV